MTWKRSAHVLVFCVLSLVMLMMPERTVAQGERPRVYLMAPVGINALSATYIDMSSNMNFFQSILTPEAEVTSEVLALNYNRFFAIRDRFAELWVTGIFGSVDGTVRGTPLGYQFTRYISGFVSYGEIIEQQDGSEGDMLRFRAIYTF